MDNNSWRGRLLGAFIGFFLPVTGSLLLGFFLGWLLIDRPRNIELENARRAKETFTNTKTRSELIEYTFALMGYVARGAGRINEDQIRKAEQFMTIMKLNDELKAMAARAFNAGKAADFNLDSVTNAILSDITRDPTVLSYILEIQVQIALADGRLEDLEYQRLLEIAVKLGFNAAAMQELIRIRVAEMEFRNGTYSSGTYTGGAYHGGGQQSSGGAYGAGGGEQYRSGGEEQHRSYSGSTGSAEADKLAKAYEILGVRSTDSWQDIKKAHKRLMLKYHPDRLASQGLPPEMVRMYTEKAKDIQAAFELVKKYREEK